MYPPQFIDHFENPRHVGELPPPAVTVEVMNPVCGDILRLGARWEAGVIAEARFKARGCTACLVCGSLIAEWLPGKSAAEASRLTRDEVDAMAGGLIPESKHAAALAWDAVRQLIKRAGG